MRHTLALAVLVLGTVLVGVLAVGTPVAGNDSVAAVTAGINLGTSPASRPSSSTHQAPAAPLRAAVLTLLLALAVTLLTREQPDDPLASDPSTLLGLGTLARRGPPAT